MNGVWSVKYRLGKGEGGESDYYVMKRYGLQDLKNIIKELKIDIKENGGIPVSTWILEYIFHIFEKENKNTDYDLLSIAITNERKGNDGTS